MIIDIKIDATQIPEVELRVLCAAFLDGVKRFYDCPENVAGFEQWLEKRKGGETVGQEDGGKTPAGIPEPCTAADCGAAARRF